MSGGNDAFLVKDSGVYFVEPSIEPQWICSRIDILSDTRDEKSENWGRLLQFKDRDGKQHSWAMPMAMMAGDHAAYREILLSFGVQISTSRKARDKLAEYLQSYQVSEKVLCVDQIGWHNDSFVLVDKTFSPDEKEKPILQLGGQIESRLKTAGSLQDWRDRVAAYCEGNSRLELALSLGFTPPLLKLLGEENGGIHLRGSSSVGKTTALLLAGSVWGGGTHTGFVRTWRSTANGIESMAREHNDALLLLDELKQVDPHDAGIVAYQLSLGIGKQRSNVKGLARKSAEWRLLFLSSGEISLESHMSEVGQKVHAGQEVRMLDLPADAEKGMGLFEMLHGFQSPSEFAQILKRNSLDYYGTPIRAFLEKLTQNMDSAIQFVQSVQTQFSKNFLPSEAEGQVTRACNRFALIAAAGELAVHYKILPWKPTRAFEATSVCFNAWLSTRNNTKNSEEEKAMDRVISFFQQYGKSRFSEIVNGNHEESYTSPQKRAGFWHLVEGDTEWLVFTEVFTKEICKGLDSRFVAKCLIKRGHLISGSGGKSATSMNLPGMRKTRVYRIRSTIMDDSQEGVPGVPAVLIDEITQDFTGTPMFER